VGFRSAQTVDCRATGTPVDRVPASGAWRLVAGDRCSARRADRSSTEDASAAHSHAGAASALVGERANVTRFAQQASQERQLVDGPACADTRREPRWSDQ
jgi:hypothetical protein